MPALTKKHLERADPRFNFGRLDGDVLLNQNEVASILGLSPWTIQTWRNRGRGPVYVQLGHRIPRYRVRDLKTWMDQQQQQQHVGA